MNNSNQKGKKGEYIAKHYLEKNNHIILYQNYHTKWGEIDIIAINPTHILKFIEVKNYKKNTLIHPLKIIQRQYPKIQKAALYYISKHSIKYSEIQFDAILIENGVISNHYERI